MDKSSEGQALPSEQDRLPGDLRDIGLDSEALARLLEEVRNDTSFTPAAYNRTYNRHNR
ncbi:YhhA family cyclophane-containing RiPP [Bradyrhizobium ganzhouense]|uniref:YhhA family cyclophane-containing RiPP n=1 Tax=Bradyrhizobium ganzhouense TaxID=1179767 RepID=UPI003CEEB6CC